jgi:hypothetical protein
MNVELTEEEIEAIIIDVSHVLDKCALKKEHKEPRQSLLSKLKPQPTREEITAKWVKDNNIVVGSKVTINGKAYTGNEVMSLTIGIVIAIAPSLIVVSINGSHNLYEVESLEPYKEEFVPFTFEDRDLFRDRWVRRKETKDEYKIIQIQVDSLDVGVGSLFNYAMAFERLEFIDGSVFGKLK